MERKRIVPERYLVWRCDEDGTPSGLDAWVVFPEVKVRAVHLDPRAAKVEESRDGV